MFPPKRGCIPFGEQFDRFTPFAGYISETTKPGWFMDSFSDKVILNR
jgi:hypothetical protein